MSQQLSSDSFALTPRYFALIPCAGSGQRAQQGISSAHATLPKQYWQLNGKPMLWYSLATFVSHPQISATALILAPQDTHFATQFTPFQAALEQQQKGTWNAYYCGGDHRQTSVLNGLAQLAHIGVMENDWVLVHDAARPGFNQALLDRLINGVGHHPVGGILALPVTDTMKQATTVDAEDARTTNATHEKTAVIQKTMARDGLWQAQTPQMFRFGVLLHALQMAKMQRLTLTDEASAVELLGKKPLLIPGSVRNLKVTYADDLATAEALFHIEM